jgi:non-specific serine/threonine protein kinase
VTLQQAGNYQKARALYEESLAIHREMGGKSGTGLVLYYLALLNFEEKSYTQASSLLRESLRFYYEVRAVRYLSTLIQALVKSVAQEGDPQRAACLQGIYEKMRETVGATRPAESHSENEHNEYVEALRLSLSPERFEQFLDRGRAMTLEEAIAFALSA